MAFVKRGKLITLMEDGHDVISRIEQTIEIEIFLPLVRREKLLRTYQYLSKLHCSRKYEIFLFYLNLLSNIYQCES